MNNELNFAQKLSLKIQAPMLWGLAGAVAAKILPIEFAAFCSGVI